MSNTSAGRSVQNTSAWGSSVFDDAFAVVVRDPRPAVRSMPSPSPSAGRPTAKIAGQSPERSRAGFRGDPHFHFDGRQHGRQRAVQGRAASRGVIQEPAHLGREGLADSFRVHPVCAASRPRRPLLRLMYRGLACSQRPRLLHAGGREDRQHGLQPADLESYLAARRAYRPTRAPHGLSAGAAETRHAATP